MSGSFASICRRVCDSNAARPLGRDGERRRANATSEAAPLGASALSAFSFSGITLTTNSPTISRKNYKVLSSHHIEKGVERNSQLFFQRDALLIQYLCGAVGEVTGHGEGSGDGRVR